jgi:adenosylcobinamide kinase / adenosylcobinamide-phosphate guanylyltransferase
MASIILITGGCRSGKSILAQQIAEKITESKVYIATAPALDEEMALRIARHQAARQASGWQTVEETLDIAGVIHKMKKNQTLLVDCLTLWINNLMYEAEKRGTEISEDDIVEKCRNIVAACHVHTGTIVFVTNEVGMGIVPDNPAARRFRDLAGRCNQFMAAAAEVVIFMASGLPLYLKGKKA